MADTNDIVIKLRAAGCVYAEDEARLITREARSETELADMVQKRIEGLPLEQILGWAEFDGRRISVGPGVFVPRRRSEFLVHKAAKLTKPGATVVDLCCGSGALGAAVAAQIERVQLYAADIDPIEVQCARRNLADFGGQVYEGDLFEALPVKLQGHIDTLIANVPYVPTGSIEFLPSEARVYEPLVALDGGSDGLDVLRRVAAAASQWLAPGGHLLVEMSERQADLAAAIMADNGLKPRVARSEEFGATVIVGTQRS